MSKDLTLSQQHIENRIFTIRGKQVMFDRDLAEMYQVEVKRLNEQVKRNIDRFPETFRFQLNSQEKDELVANCDRFYSHRLKASCATNGYLLDFYWKLGRDIEAKQYTNTYGSGFYKNLSQDLKNEMPGVKGFSPTNLKYMSYFYKLYAPLQANCPQLADNFIEDLYIADIQRVVAQSKNRPQTADDFKLLFLIPWAHHRRIIDKCKDDMDKALFFVRKTWENNWGRDVLLNWLDTDLYERDGKAIKMNCI